MNEINNFFNKIDKNLDKGFINYFPNYLKSSNQEEIKDLFFISSEENINKENSQTSFIQNEEIREEKLDKSQKKGDLLSSIPVNLFMEENNVNPVKPQKFLFGPTNLPTKIDEMYINPRYL